MDLSSGLANLPSKISLQSFANLSYWSFILSLVSASLIGSFHCVGMCGGLMLAAAHERKSLLINYHLARGVSYLVLGAISGAIGSYILSPRMGLYFSYAATLALALVFIFMGISLLRGKNANFSFGHGISARVLKVFPQVLQWSPRSKSIVIGFLTGFLPCGWLYSFVLMAMASQNGVLGTIILFVFWLGTLPALTAFYFGSKWVAFRLPNFFITSPQDTPQRNISIRRRQQIVGGIFILLAIFSLGYKWQMSQMTSVNGQMICK